MSYVNQLDHSLLNRHSAKEFLLSLSSSSVQSSPAEVPRAEHLNNSKEGLILAWKETGWITWSATTTGCLRMLRFLESCKTRPDFSYQRSQTVIYVDRP
jgi:hypothetical protein